MMWMRGVCKDGILEFKTSFGDTCARLDTWPRKLTASRTQCRLAIGYDSTAAALLELFRVPK